MRFSRAISVGTLSLFLLAGASSALAVTVINTIPLWNGSDTIASFGVPNTQTYGQTITVPAGETSLTSFRFLIDDEGNGAATFVAYVFAWDNVNEFITGPALYTSSPVTTPNAAGFQPYTFTIPGGIPVTAGQQYVLFATTSTSAQNNSSCRWATVPDSVYGGGTFVFQNNGNNFAALSSVAWTTSFGIDTAFGVAFGGASLDASVPTLGGSALLLLGAGLGLVGLLALRLRRN